MAKSSRAGGKAPDPRGRAAAAMQCLRCGATGHQAANCPRPPKHASSSPAGGAAKKASVEGVASGIDSYEHGLVIFEDVHGRPRVDCTMLDPGASAFLMRSGPFQRYVGHLKELGFPVLDLQLRKTNRTFHFGGDHSTTSHRIAKIPLFLNHVHGFAEAFIIRGE